MYFALIIRRWFIARPDTFQNEYDFLLKERKNLVGGLRDLYATFNIWERERERTCVTVWIMLEAFITLGHFVMMLHVVDAFENLPLNLLIWKRLKNMFGVFFYYKVLMHITLFCRIYLNYQKLSHIYFPANVTPWKTVPRFLWIRKGLVVALHLNDVFRIKVIQIKQIGIIFRLSLKSERVALSI